MSETMTQTNITALTLTCLKQPHILFITTQAMKMYLKQYLLPH